MDDAPDGVHDRAHPYGVAAPGAPAAHPRLLERQTGIVGQTPAIRLLRERLARFAPTVATVVILGETGTGKELAARAIHALSPRAKRPFVAANVAALPESTLLSELFGHERGAFTNAHARHQGLFEQAHGGTLFLDEVGEMAAQAQAALLRVLETREVRPVGAGSVRRVDVRLVAATHRHLGALVQRGLFREDLYYRLHTLVVRVPPLRRRAADLPLIARHVLATLAPEVGARSLDRSALDALGGYGWPGNVRQLVNVLRRAAIVADAPALSREHIRLALADEPGAREDLADGATVAVVAHVLAAERWNLTRAADLPLLARHVLAGLAPEVGERSLDRPALDALGGYGWPGNVRQLGNVLRRAAIADDAATLTREHIRLALAYEPGAREDPADGATAAVVAHVLAAERWNLTRAAARLGIARSTLRARIRRAGLARGS